jgi:hypothetical protein
MSFECVVFNLIAGVALRDKKELADQIPALHVTTLLVNHLRSMSRLAKAEIAKALEAQDDNLSCIHT